MSRRSVTIAVLVSFNLGLLVAWSVGAGDRREQDLLRAVRTQANLAGWRGFLDAHPANREAQAWVATLSAPAVVPPAAASAREAARPGREALLRQEIARLEALFTERSAAAAAQKPAAPRTPDVRLAVAPLPAAPTADDVDAYLLAVQRRLQPVTSYRDSDPDVALLRVIPSAFLEQLLEAACTSQVGCFRSFAAVALPDVVTTGQQEVVLRWLPRLPALITVVERRHWQEEALPILRGHLAKVNDFGVQVTWVRIIASDAKRSDYPLLQATILSNKYGYWQRDLCREVAALPDFPLRETVTACWAARQKTNGSAAFLPYAAEYGAYDALARIVACVTVREPQLSSAVAEKWLDERTNAYDDRLGLVHWLGPADDPPVYDAETRRWHRVLPAVPGF